SGLPGSGFASFLAIDPVTPSTFYAVFPSLSAPAGSTLFKSMDGGQSWAALDGVASYTSVTNLVIDPKIPSIIYAVAERYSAAGPAWSVLRSADGGQTWKAYDVGLPANSYFRSLAIDPAVSSRIYAGASGIELGSPTGSPAGGVFTSTDGGQSWHAS